jgi:hypothetical protein
MRPQLGGRAGGRDEGEAATRQHRGAQVHHVGALGERAIGRRAGLRVLPHGGALAGERRFVDLQGRAPRQARLGRDRRAGLEQDHVARHQLCGGDPGEAAVAADRRVGNRERPQAGQRHAGAPLGEEADRGVQQEGGEDGDRLRPLAERGGDAGPG